MRLPKLYKIRQALEYPLVADVAAEVRKALAQLGLASRLTPGARVAVTGGSRGVANIAIILRTVCDSLRGLGARPFIAHGRLGFARALTATGDYARAIESARSCGVRRPSSRSR